MKTGIVGSRSFSDYNKFVKELDNLNLPISEIVSGGAKGVDTLARMYANNMNISCIEYIPDWKRHGKSAAFQRNHLIVKRSETIIAFWDGKSKGTAHTISLCKKNNKPIIIILI